MPADRVNYRPLGRRARDPFALAIAASYRLFLGDDHLLHVSNQRFTESYKRFYFRDIQALVWTQNGRRNTYNLILLLCGFGAALLSLALGAADPATGVISMIVFVLLLGGAGAVNTARGPTCICHIKTAVHTERLASIRRVRTAESVFAQVSPLITAAQGEWTEAVPQAAGTPPAEPPLAVLPVMPAMEPPPAPVRTAVHHEPGTFHGWLFAVLLADGATNMLDFFFTNVWPTVLSAFTMLAAVALAVAALIRQRDSDIGGGLRSVVWTTLGAMGVSMALASVLYGVFVSGNPEIAQNQWEWLLFWARTSPLDSPLVFGTFVFAILTSLGLGLTGFMLLFRHRRQSRQKPPEATTPATQPGSDGPGQHQPGLTPS